MCMNLSGLASEKGTSTSLRQRTSSHPYTIWCVDSVSGDRSTERHMNRLVAGLLFIFLLISEDADSGIIRCEVYNLEESCQSCFESLQVDLRSVPYVRSVRLREDEKIIIMFDEADRTVDVAQIMLLLHNNGYKRVEVFFMIQGQLTNHHNRPAVKLENSDCFFFIEEAKDPMLIGNLEKLANYFSNRVDKTIVLMGPVTLPRDGERHPYIAANIFMRHYATFPKIE